MPDPVSASGIKIGELSELLIGLPGAIGLTIVANDGELLPAPESPAQREVDDQAEFVRRNTHPVLDTYSQIHVRLVGAMQNLVAVGNLLRSGPIEPACPVLCRSVLESAAVVCWLLGDLGDTRTRVVRGRAQHIYELEEDAGILRDVELEGDADLLADVPSDPEGARLIEQIRSTIDEVAADCEAVGIPVERTKRGRVFVAEARLPSASGVVKDVLGDNALIAYRMLCGSIHGSTNTALQSMTRAPLASSLEGVSVMMPTNDPLALIPSLGLAMDGFMTANDRRFEALGWSTEPWDEWKQRTKTTVVQLLRDFEERGKVGKRPAEPS